MKIFSFCGSLRSSSSNAQLLSLAKEHLRDHQWSYFDIAQLPYFDPDRQYKDTPDLVLTFRKLAGEADLIVMATPEYAHGIPGLLKNGLEWLFCDLTMKKKVVVLMGTAQGEWARDQLIEVLSTMDFIIEDHHFFLLKGSRVKVEELRQHHSLLQSSFYTFLDGALRL